MTHRVMVPNMEVYTMSQQQKDELNDFDHIEAARQMPAPS